MAEQREFQMSEEDYQIMIRAQRKPPSKPMLLVGQGVVPDDKGQLTVNDTWKMLGLKLGFDWRTVRPHPRKGDRYFLAEPMEIKGHG